MGRLPASNQDSIEVKDRAAIGPQPDNTPATGGSPTGGGGGGGSPTGPAGGDLTGTYPNPTLAAIGGGIIGPIGDSTHVARVTRDAKGRVSALTSVAIAYPSSLPPSGPAGGDLTGTYPNPTVDLLSGVTSIRQVPVGYATGGTIQLRFDLGSFDDIGLTVNASFSPAGSSGMQAGRVQELVLRNTTGGVLTLTWNGSWVISGPPLPTTLAAGAAIRVRFTCQGTTEASIAASYWFILQPTGVPPGAYTNTNLTVGADGRLTAAANGTPGMTNPMTTLGDIIYEDAAPAPARLPGNIAGYVKYLSQFGTGSVSAAPVWRMAPKFNVRDFGAVGDGVTDDIAAFNSATSLAIAAGGGCLYAPRGDYLLSTTWTITQTGNGQGITVEGDGASVTRFYWPNATNGLDIIGTVAQTEGATTSNAVTVQDFSFCTGQAGGTRAFKIDGKNTNGTEMGFVMRRCTLEGYTTGKYWGDGIYLLDAPNFVVDSVRMVSAANTGDAILLESNTGQTIGNFRSVNIQGYDTGVHSIGSNAYEGITFDFCTFVSVNFGFKLATSTGEEQFNITNCHIAANSGWITAANCERIYVTNANFHQLGTSSGFTAIDINANCNWFQCHGGYFRVGANVHHMVLDSSNHIVHGNNFTGGSATAILLNAGCGAGLYFGNQQFDSGGVNRLGSGVVTDSSGLLTNQIFNNY